LNSEADCAFAEELNKFLAATTGQVLGVHYSHTRLPVGSNTAGASHLYCVLYIARGSLPETTLPIMPFDQQNTEEVAVKEEIKILQQKVGRLTVACTILIIILLISLWIPDYDIFQYLATAILVIALAVTLTGREGAVCHN
jgi:hypothetical protein